MNVETNAEETEEGHKNHMKTKTPAMMWEDQMCEKKTAK
jgi:hypothetical protein